MYYEANAFCKTLGLRCLCVYGGTGVTNQLGELKRGAEVIICTPGRMIEVLTLNNGNITNLRRVTYVVLDEADRLFDTGFEQQISRILANIRPDRQTLLFSATFPKAIENLAKNILKSPIEIIVGTRGSACKNVEQFVEIRDESNKFLRLLEILGKFQASNTQVLIFVDKFEEADELFKELHKLGYFCLVSHGKQDQEDREFTLSEFKAGKRKILITTSLFARGLDVKNLGLVINFKCPNHLEDYVHRVGRTGRAGNKGVAYTFISPDEAHMAWDIMRALEISKQTIPPELKKLVRCYKEKLDNGEAEKFRVNGYQGNGHIFTKSERDQVKEMRNQLAKGYIKQTSDDEEDEPVVKSFEKTDKELETDKKKKREEQDRKLFKLYKDPKARQIAVSAGMTEVKVFT